MSFADWLGEIGLFREAGAGELDDYESVEDWEAAEEGGLFGGFTTWLRGLSDDGERGED